MAALTYSAIGLTCDLLWTGFVAPAILRRLGVPSAFGIWRIDRRNQHLNMAQFVWVVACSGGGLGCSCISRSPGISTGDCFGDRFSYLSPKLTLVRLAISLGGGWVVGVLSGAHRTSGGLNVDDPRDAHYTR